MKRYLTLILILGSIGYCVANDTSKVINSRTLQIEQALGE